MLEGTPKDQTATALSHMPETCTHNTRRQKPCCCSKNWKHQWTAASYAVHPGLHLNITDRNLGNASQAALALINGLSRLALTPTVPAQLWAGL
jgi:hypothetical protein